MAAVITRETNGDSGVRPLNPLAALTLVLVFPRRTFERLRERPHWLLPLVFVAACVLVRYVVLLEAGLMDEIIQREAFRTGADLDVTRSAAVVGAVVASFVALPVVTLIQALFLKVAGKLLGGRARFGLVFSTVAYASVPVGIGALALTALLPVTRSANAMANLAFLVDPRTRPFLWSLATELDLFYVWFFMLLGIAAEPILGLTRRRARLGVVAFAVVYVLVMSWMGRGSTQRQVDQYDGWLSFETAAGTLHCREELDRGVIDEARETLVLSGERVASIVGPDAVDRIDCYLYPSVDEKARTTGNRAPAHGVTWASAVHVAWEGGADVALTREMAKVAGARTLGKVYNPFVRDGLAVYAGGVWGGEPVLQVAGELLSDGALPLLAVLTDPVAFGRIDSRVSQPAAGAFVAFFVGDQDGDAYRRFYSGAAEGRLPVQNLLESAFGDSLCAIERRWISFVRDAAAVEGDVGRGPE